jgi:hypothetical protein
MEFNDASNPEVSLYHDALFWAATNSTDFPIADFTRSANFALEAVLRKIFMADARWQYDDENNTDLPIATTSLVSGQDNYTLADEHLKLARVRVKDEQGNWVTLTPSDRRNLSDANLIATGVPATYDKMGRSLLLYPVPHYASSGGLEITYQRGSNYFVVGDTSKVPGIPSPFHRYISLYAARDFVIADSVPDKLQAIDAEIQRMDADLIDFFASRDRDEPPSMTVAPTLEIY